MGRARCVVAIPSPGSGAASGGADGKCRALQRLRRSDGPSWILCHSSAVSMGSHGSRQHRLFIPRDTESRTSDRGSEPKPVPPSWKQAVVSDQKAFPSSSFCASSLQSSLQALTPFVHLLFIERCFSKTSWTAKSHAWSARTVSAHLQASVRPGPRCILLRLHTPPTSGTALPAPGKVSRSEELPSRCWAFVDLQLFRMTGGSRQWLSSRAGWRGRYKSNVKH